MSCIGINGGTSVQETEGPARRGSIGASAAARVNFNNEFEARVAACLPP